MERVRVFKALRGVFIIFAILIAMVWFKTYSYGQNQYKEGEKAMAAGDLKNAISDYETSIHMYSPFAGYVPASANRLWQIGQRLEKSGDYDWALIAYRSLRSSLYGVRSFYAPYRDWIARSESQIGKVLALQAEKVQAGAPASQAGGSAESAGQGGGRH
jgi:tetratricopeptide (TPR) repeat protein